MRSQSILSCHKSPNVCMMSKSLSIVAAFVLLACSFGSTTASGQDSDSAAEIELPQDPRAWINSSPISVEAMKGKSIVLYFFEEGCPRCRERWPEILSAAQANQTEPVQLVVVNSGSSPAEVARYVKSAGITVPVIVDVDRSLEKRAGVKEVSLQNIWQARVIDPNGKVQYGSANDMAETIRKAGADASWHVDPMTMPAEILPTWKMIEFGNFAGASKVVTRLAKDRNEARKAAGESLMAYVQTKIDALNDEAAAAVQAGDNWKAYQRYEWMHQNFDGYVLPESAADELARLKSDELVRDNLAALKLWELTEKAVASGRVSATRVDAMLEKIIEKYPGTEAATRASEMIGRTQ